MTKDVLKGISFVVGRREEGGVQSVNTDEGVVSGSERKDTSKNVSKELYLGGVVIRWDVTVETIHWFRDNPP